MDKGWFLRYEGVVKSIIHRHGIRADDFEDVLHNVWLKLMIAPPKYENIPYVQVTAKNACLDFLNANSRRIRALNPVELEFAPEVPSSVDVHARVEAKMYLDELPDHIKEATVSRAFGSTVKDLGDSYGKGEITWKSRVFRWVNIMRRRHPEIGVEETEGRIRRRTVKAPPPPVGTIKVCTRCNTPKDVSEFYVCKGHVKSRCKSCFVEIRKENYKKVSKTLDTSKTTGIQ